ncbi:type II toxin-antitoxin system VapC family toxin [Cupriavidus respiraculi]|uniref:PIN domain-containing protein n=1 Tax=Cupriavidus respiraculi TaxID=195930 RepID=A0ABM8X170_9BURK|nr:type II toxin-antitoxin system VapC family toxin [Cupriavidus respiraculi]CAG9173593.1 hypothetical protein LMG21510_02307 [Cupriavidus respiraculi]
MNLLLDTHIALWALYQPSSLPATARSYLEDPSNDLAVSVAAVWEVAIKNAKAPDSMPAHPAEFTADIDAAGWKVRSIEVGDVIRLHGLPAIHSDPFDRLMIAQAMSHGLELLTADTKIAAYQSHPDTRIIAV